MNGLRFKELIQAGYLWLKSQEQAVNAFNVYPVPDGDTGTNMRHTIEAAWKAIANSEDTSVGAVAKAVANGALRGSRGNSGIILSQLLRGFARSLDGKDEAMTVDLAQAFREAANTAYGGVKNPVEGTILTVARETADAAEQAAKEDLSLFQMLDRVTDAAHESVQRTPTLLKILKEAGVVDSGGYGFYAILDGMRRYLRGDRIDAPPAEVEIAKAATGEAATEESGYGYDVQYLIHALPGTTLNVDEVRIAIENMGDCPLVLGDEQIIKVHVHVPDPGVPISYGVKLGSLRDVVVEDMQAQSEVFLPSETKKAAEPEHEDEVETGIVAVAAGDGLLKLFKELGARAIVEGGQTMNPSVEDLLNAIQRAKARNVIVLPNNGNIVMTAQQAAQISEIPAHVVTTKTLPQGIGALMAFNFEQDTHANVDSMAAASKRITTGEITISTRDVTINNVSVKNGQIIGLIDDKLSNAGEDVAQVLLDLLKIAGTDGREVISLYYGNNQSEAQANAVAEQVREAYPDQAVDVYYGGQPHYYFVVGIE